MMFYKETHFQDAPIIGKVASDWDIVKLGDVLLLLRNGLTIRQSKEGNGYPVTRIETISEEYIDPNKVGYIQDLSESEINEYRLQNGDILFSHINSLDHIGKTAIYEGKPELLIHGMNLLLLRPDKEKIHPKFLLYLLRLYRVRNIFRAISKKAVNQASINQTELGRIKILLPPLEEQRVIAGVLGVVDSVIAKTDEVIAKTERLKRGLMQILLTRGIGHKEFKETEIGKIPKTWDVLRLEDVTKQFISGGTPSTKNPKYWNGDIPWIRSVHLTRYYVDETSIEQFITKEGLENSASNIVPKGNVIIATRVGVGKSAVNLIDVAINQDLTGLIIDKSKIDPFFLVWYLLSPKILSILESFTRGTTIKGIAQNHIKNLLIPLPPIDEQRRIAEILSAVDRKLEFERYEKARLERIKRGLMDLLLTGKVRVKVE